MIAVELRVTCNVRSDVKVPWSNGRVDRQNSSNFAAEADFNYDKKKLALNHWKNIMKGK